jgi:hypothetical protein
MALGSADLNSGERADLISSNPCDLSAGVVVVLVIAPGD